MGAVLRWMIVRHSERNGLAAEIRPLDVLMISHMKFRRRCCSDNPIDLSGCE